MEYAGSLGRSSGHGTREHGYAVTCVEASVDPVWDALVEATPGGDLAQTTLWAVSRQRLGFRADRITIMTAGQKLLGGCLMYSKRVAPAWWVASIPRGPLVFTPGSSAASAVVREIVASARRGGVRVLVIQPPEAAPALDAFPALPPKRRYASISGAATRSFSAR